MHVALSLPDAAAAYDAGWAEPHLYAGRTLGGGVSLPAGMVLVYAPRTAEEARTPPLLPIPSRRAPRACRSAALPEPATVPAALVASAQWAPARARASLPQWRPCPPMPCSPSSSSPIVR